MSTESDNAGVVALPPLLYGVTFVAVLALRWFWPLPILGRTMGLYSGLALAMIAVAVAIWGSRTLRIAGTNVNPSLPATVVVTSGPFRYSRNPLYFALTVFYLGLTLAFNTWWGIILLVPLLIVMHYGVVLREERYLEQKFGETYRQYRSAVRRYL